MATDPKELQTLQEDGVETRALSTFSDVHITRGQALNVDDLGSPSGDMQSLVDSMRDVNSLQLFREDQDVETKSWSTFSRVHVTQIAR